MIAGIVAPILRGGLIVSGDCGLAIDAIFLFLLIGAFATAFGIRKQWLLDKAVGVSTGPVSPAL